MDRRLFFLLMAGTGLIVFIGGVAIWLILSEAAEPAMVQRHFRTTAMLEPPAALLNLPGETLDFGRPADGGALPAPCYPTLPLEITYTAWNPDPAKPGTTLAPYVHAYDTRTFQPGERVHLTVYRPDQSIYLQQTVTAPVEPLFTDCFAEEAAVGLSWAFTPDDPAGEWQVQMRGDAGQTIQYRTTLIAHTTPWISRYCHADNEYQLLLDGFRPNEAVTLLLVEAAGRMTDRDQRRVATTTKLYEWQIQVDSQGQHRLTLAENLVPAPNLYWLVTDSENVTVGLDQSGLVSLNRYQACADDPFEAVLAPTALPTLENEVAVAPTYTLSSVCGNAPTPRFAIGDEVVVDFKNLGALRVMRFPDSPTEEEVTLAQAYDGNHLLILAGPVCGASRDRWMWRVRLLHNDFEGWAAEGIAGDNWICPLAEPECGS